MYSFFEDAVRLVFAHKLQEDYLDEIIREAEIQKDTSVPILIRNE
jgi:hypothetical protein